MARHASRARLELARDQILAFRRRVGALDERLAPGPDSLRRAGWAGFQDSMPRSALLSIHARVSGTQPSTWEDPALAQTWGPRFHVYVVPARDLPVFTLGLLPDEPRSLRVAEDMAARLLAFAGGARLPHEQAGVGVGVHPNALRYGAATGTILIRWDGARQATVWTMPRPLVEPGAARLELARRFLHVFGPTTSESFGRWAGLAPGHAAAAFEALGKELMPVRTPFGDAVLPVVDESEARKAIGPRAPARLLPSGDSFWLAFRPEDRAFLVPDDARRGELWTSRVWPGALLVDGEFAGTWRRAHAAMTVSPWRQLTRAEREAVEAEAASLPLPGLERRVVVRWES
jgi:hypothetical protein